MILQTAIRNHLNILCHRNHMNLEIFVEKIEYVYFEFILLIIINCGLLVVVIALDKNIWNATAALLWCARMFEDTIQNPIFQRIWPFPNLQEILRSRCSVF